jgi:hypothetical protein
MVEGILKLFSTHEGGRLKALLTSWVEHNKLDGEGNSRNGKRESVKG